MDTTFHSIAYFAQNESSGHFYHYHKSVQEALKPHLAHVAVYVPKNSHFVNPPQHWQKWFSPFYNKSNRKKFWKDCVRLFRQKSDGKRIFFIEFFGRRDFFLYSMAAFLFAKKNDTLWVLYRDDLTIRNKKDLRMIRFCSKLLKKKCDLKPLTDNELLADYYSPWFGQRPTVLPILTAKHSPFKVSKKKKLVCSWLGNPRPDKGAHEIAHLVEIEDPASSKIELSVSGATFFPPIKNQVDLQLRRVALAEDEYFEALSRSDVILLPYCPRLYKQRTSGVFVEAILMGKVPVVKAGSWLAHELSRFDLDELILDWNAPDFFSNLFVIVSDSKIITKLKKMQEAYLAFHGEDNFAKSLQKVVQS